MSLTFIDLCPKCGRPTTIRLNDGCINRLNDGTTCGFALPTALGYFNGKVRAKIEKHTNVPTGAFNGQISYTSSTGAYLDHLDQGRISGSIYLDTTENYFFSYVTPSGGKPIAVVCPGFGLPVTDASGFKMPLNSKLQNLHGHYSNLDSGTIFVATPEGTIVERPNGAHPNFTYIYQSGKVVATWDHVQQTGFAGPHVIL